MHSHAMQAFDYDDTYGDYGEEDSQVADCQLATDRKPVLTGHPLIVAVCLPGRSHAAALTHGHIAPACLPCYITSKCI